VRAAHRPALHVLLRQAADERRGEQSHQEPPPNF